ncbi:pseudaminic acid cytidylyltransferase [Pseudahrensia aquimaris]|uniref:Pseudaminic acid cytidylyltransferase n=1 Tax=Pseudahrensia aquimaris TaxID=744461 RepID=A0ABW3FGG8_9HYPH
MKLAIIPARGGSKRIPRKNLKDFHGRPIIGYSIDAALAAQNIDRVIVSTDDQEIAEVAKRLGAEVPFIRPDHLSDDHATTMDVLHHAVEWARAEGDLQALCCLYATAPMVSAADLDAAFELFEVDDCEYAFSATEYAFPIQRAFHLQGEAVTMFEPEHLSTRSQDLTPAYHDAGQFYWCKPQAIAERKPIFAPHSRAYLMDRKRVQDIDTPEDWEFAEALHALANEPKQ